ncbi:MAG: DUF7003 family protein [bacterium]|jgi:hypothetical protein
MFPHTTADILNVLDSCAGRYSFPMLDNGYICLAAARLGLFRSETDWAITTEVFGFSPRTGVPDLCIGSFASSLINRKEPHDYFSPEAHKAYLERQPNDETLFINHIEDGDWMDDEGVPRIAANVRLRRTPVLPPEITDYKRYGIELENPGSPQVFEFCRWLAATQREAVLATEAEQRHHLPDSLTKIMQLDEWHHPDLVAGELPSETETFRQLAEVLVTGDLSRYKPNEMPNTHWSNWPDGGTL